MNATNDLLYSHIKLEINGETAKDLGRMATLNRCCQEFPYLVNRIGSAELRWCYKEDVETYNEFLGHLAKSTSLTKLTCELCHDLSWTAISALYNYSDGSFTHLKDLQIELNIAGSKEVYVSTEQFLKLCELPKLEVFTVCAPITGFGNGTRSETILAKLGHLHFWASHPVPISALESILPRVPNLTCLQLSAPGEGTQVNRMFANGCFMPGFNRDEPLRPSFYGDLLAPVAASLKHLVMDADNVEIPSHDGSHIDLSRFTNISRLELSSSLLFGSGKLVSSYAWAQRVWEILPPHLEKFRLLFDGDQGLFWSVGDMRQHARSKTFDQLWSRTVNNGYVDWLFGLLDRSRNKASYLVSITINEQPIIDKDQNWKIVQWHMTDDLVAAATAAGVKLAIKLRVPRIFESSALALAEDSLAYGAEGTVSYEEDDAEVSANEAEW
ncbi:uncharacterized protein F4807DRAFT_321473 [Annulohypoxylon truncatum]|uniref:uncharacterized protein n=1 Tax=Annulohypoxylon truncatum TaxID=327061 RepID=UPI0020085ACE|nr:uncharacterized protein F4807DRAFT_321473 [Annulohypoxylon truncatum]KAI1204740.1 hypothetical protein F4807DRAFT_321473 [Annulohypoxylon truncatum]